MSVRPKPLSEQLQQNGLLWKVLDPVLNEKGAIESDGVVVQALGRTEDNRDTLVTIAKQVGARHAIVATVQGIEVQEFSSREPRLYRAGKPQTIPLETAVAHLDADHREVIHAILFNSGIEMPVQ